MTKRVLWTKAEDEILLSEYKTKGARYVAEKVGRSVDAVQARARLLAGKRKYYPPKRAGDTPKKPKVNMTLCWSCRLSVNPGGANLCPWSGLDKNGEPSFRPAEGWEIKDVKRDGRTFKAVVSCPLFEEG